MRAPFVCCIAVATSESRQPVINREEMIIPFLLLLLLLLFCTQLIGINREPMMQQFGRKKWTRKCKKRFYRLEAHSSRSSSSSMGRQNGWIDYVMIGPVVFPMSWLLKEIGARSVCKRSPRREYTIQCKRRRVTTSVCKKEKKSERRCAVNERREREVGR